MTSERRPREASLRERLGCASAARPSRAREERHRAEVGSNRTCRGHSSTRGTPRSGAARARGAARGTERSVLRGRERPRRTVMRPLVFMLPYSMLVAAVWLGAPACSSSDNSAPILPSACTPTSSVAFDGGVLEDGGRAVGGAPTPPQGKREPVGEPAYRRAAASPAAEAERRADRGRVAQVRAAARLAAAEAVGLARVAGSARVAASARETGSARAAGGSARAAVGSARAAGAWARAGGPARAAASARAVESGRKSNALSARRSKGLAYTCRLPRRDHELSRVSRRAPSHEIDRGARTE